MMSKSFCIVQVYILNFRWDNTEYRCKTSIFLSSRLREFLIGFLPLYIQVHQVDVVSMSKFLNCCTTFLAIRKNVCINAIYIRRRLYYTQFPQANTNIHLLESFLCILLLIITSTRQRFLNSMN